LFKYKEVGRDEGCLRRSTMNEVSMMKMLQYKYIKKEAMLRLMRESSLDRYRGHDEVSMMNMKMIGPVVLAHIICKQMTRLNELSDHRPLRFKIHFIGEEGDHRSTVCRL